MESYIAIKIKKKHKNMDNLTNRTLSKKVRYIRIYTVWFQLYRRQKHTEVSQDIIG